MLFCNLTVALGYFICKIEHVAMRKLLLIYIFFIVYSFAFGQANLQLSLNPATPNPPFRVFYGDTLVYDLEISNLDSIPFSGNVFVGFKGSNNNGYDSILLGALQIAPNSFVQRSIAIDVLPQYFKTGPEVVVVWPIFDGRSGSQVADFIYVKNHLNDIDQELVMAKDYFVLRHFLSCNRCEISFKRVRIFDLTGSVLFTQELPSFPLELPLKNAGLYFIQLEAVDGITSTIRFMYR